MSRAFVLVAVLAAGVAMAEPLFAVQPPGRTRIFVTGETGEGKSTWLNAFMAKVRRVAHYDSEHENERFPWLYVDEFAESWRDFEHGVVRIAVRPRPGRAEGGKSGEHELYCRTLSKLRYVLSVHAEVGGYAGGGVIQPWFLHLVTRGRKRGIAMVVDGQDPVMAPTILRRNLSRLVAFRLKNKASVERLAEWLDPQTAEQVRTLQDFHFLDWTPKEGALIRPPLELRSPERSTS